MQPSTSLVAPIPGASIAYDQSTNRVSVSMHLNEYLSVFGGRQHAGDSGHVMALPSHYAEFQCGISGSAVSTPRGRGRVHEAIA